MRETINKKKYDLAAVFLTLSGVLTFCIIAGSWILDILIG